MQLVVVVLLSLGVMWSGHEADHLRQSSTTVRNVEL